MHGCQQLALRATAQSQFIPASHSSPHPSRTRTLHPGCSRRPACNVIVGAGAQGMGRGGAQRGGGESCRHPGAGMQTVDRPLLPPSLGAPSHTWSAVPALRPARRRRAAAAAAPAGAAGGPLLRCACASGPHLRPSPPSPAPAAAAAAGCRRPGGRPAAPPPLPGPPAAHGSACAASGAEHEGGSTVWSAGQQYRVVSCGHGTPPTPSHSLCICCRMQPPAAACSRMQQPSSPASQTSAAPPPAAPAGKPGPAGSA